MKTGAAELRDQLFVIVRGSGRGTAGVAGHRCGVSLAPTTDLVLGTNSLGHNFKLVIQEVFPNSGLVVIVNVKHISDTVYGTV